MTEYSFVTIWKLEAPIEKVWEAIYHSEHWPLWWDYIENVIEIKGRDNAGVDSVRRYTWKTRLPYKLTFDTRVTKVEPPFMLEGVATGELNGFGKWCLSEEGSVTTVRYEWTVRTTKRWMNWLSPIARPLFKWNHDAVMRKGGERLAQLLNAKLIQSE